MHPRAWFRLDEVLPLAEHAMACVEHTLGAVDRFAGVSGGPALIWYASRHRERLCSNGVPVWYGRNNVRHTAAASTWRRLRAAAHGTGTPDRPGRGYATLALGAVSGRRSLIDRLRAARDDAGFWLALDTDGKEYEHLTGDAVQLHPERRELAPPEAHWIPATVTLPAPWAAPYPALVPDGYTTNEIGDQIPRFGPATVRRMAGDFAAIPAKPSPALDARPHRLPVLRFCEDFLVIARPTDADGRGASTERITDLLLPDAEGLYAVGAHQWRWQLATDDSGAIR